MSKSLIIGFLAFSLSGLLNVNAHASERLEKLLKDIGVTFSKMEKDVYKIYVEVQNQTTIVFAKEKIFPKSTSKGEQAPDLDLVYFYTLVCSPRSNKENPPAQLRKMCEVNGTLTIGKVFIDSDDGTIYYNSWLWLATISETILAAQLTFTHSFSSDLRPMLCNY